MGAKKKPFYRVVVVDSRAPRDGKTIDSLGFYNPLVDPPAIRIDQEKAINWLRRGAKMTDTAASIFKRAGLSRESEAKSET